MAKKREQQSMSLFEIEQPTVVQTVAPPKIKDACPQCGGKSQATAHPIDHEGKTRYCVVCATPEGPYYFTSENKVPF